MIVRINQIDVSKLQTDGGWPAGPRTGPLPASWAADAHAFELLILSQDEKQQPLTDAFRQHQLRQMIPQAAIALTSTHAPPPTPVLPILLRLDGTVAADELLPAWRHLIEANGSGQYAFTGCVKSDDATSDVTASVRLVPSWRHLSAVCNDTRLGLERSVRLRLLEVPNELLPEALSIPDADDIRWERLLPNCGLYISTTAGMNGLHLVVRQMDASQVKARVMQRLMAVARGESAIP